jgi:hypothetical protein
MKTRINKFKDLSPVEFLVLRDKLGLRRYRKTIMRDREKLKILLSLWLKKIEEKEKDNFISSGYRRRRLNV